MNNILWQQNSCPCNEYSAEAGMAGKQEITADGDQTRTHQPSEGGDKMGGNSLVH